MEQKIKSYFADKPEIAAVYLFGSQRKARSGKEFQIRKIFQNAINLPDRGFQFSLAENADRYDKKDSGGLKMVDREIIVAKTNNANRA